MYHLKQLFRVACLILTTGKEAFGQMKPSNAFAAIGGRAILNCSDPLISPNWIMSKDGTSTNQLVIAASCIITTNLRNRYDVDKTGGPPFVCNLIVFNTTMDQAGVYWCIGIDRSNALLTVLDSSPTLTYNNTAGENVVITCSLNYNGSVEPASTLRPHFYWTDYTGNNASNIYNPPPGNNSVVSQLTVTAGRKDIMPYTCHVYLQLMPPATTGYATNTPSVDSSATSPTITVLSRPASTVAPTIPVSPSTAIITITRTTTLAIPITTSSNVAIAVAIAMGVLFGISLVVNIILVIIVFRNPPSKQDLFRRTEDTREPQNLQPSDLSTPSAYEDLRRPNDISLQPTTYEELAPRPSLYVNVNSRA